MEPTHEELIEIGLTEEEIEEYLDGLSYSDMLRCFTGREAAPDELSLRVDRKIEELRAKKCK